LVSAQVNGGVDDKTSNALSGGGSVLTGTNVLVLGSDERPKSGFGSKEPGANAGPARSDSIIVMHVGFGTVRKISILRDSIADIPGHGTQKINAAYAIGGTALTIKTVESFLGNGLKINHVIQVSFSNFPKLIDALGGVDITLKKCIRSNSFSGQRVVLSKGDHHLSGRQALFFSRVRKNSCSPNTATRSRGSSRRRSGRTRPTTACRRRSSPRCVPTRDCGRTRTCGRGSSPLLAIRRWTSIGRACGGRSRLPRRTRAARSRWRTSPTRSFGPRCGSCQRSSVPQWCCDSSTTSRTARLPR